MIGIAAGDRCGVPLDHTNVCPFDGQPFVCVEYNEPVGLPERDITLGPSPTLFSVTCASGHEHKADSGIRMPDGGYWWRLLA